MSDVKKEEQSIIMANGMPIPREKIRRRFVQATLMFCGALITGIVVKGDPANTLHSSALAWAFATSAATMFAYVFGAVVDNMNLFNKK